MTDREIDLSKPVMLTDPLAAATDQTVDDDGTVTINVGEEHAGATVDVAVSRVREDDSDVGSIYQYCLTSGCLWTARWSGGTAGDDPAIAHAKANNGHRVRGGSNDEHRAFYDRQADGGDITKGLVDRETREPVTDGGEPQAGPGEFVFESDHEKGALTGLMAATAFQSVFSVGLLKRYPKWGARYFLIQAVLAALAAVSYARGTVDSPEVDQ